MAMPTRTPMLTRTPMPMPMRTDRLRYPSSPCPDGESYHDCDLTCVSSSSLAFIGDGCVTTERCINFNCEEFSFEGRLRRGFWGRAMEREAAHTRGRGLRRTCHLSA